MHPRCPTATHSPPNGGTHYNLYQFTFKAVTGAGPAVRLAMPDLSFNANKAIANNSYPFTATASTHSQLVANVSSMSVVVFRAVAASAT